MNQVNTTSASTAATDVASLEQQLKQVQEKIAKAENDISGIETRADYFDRKDLVEQVTSLNNNLAKLRDRETNLEAKIDAAKKPKILGPSGNETSASDEFEIFNPLTKKYVPYDTTTDCLVLVSKLEEKTPYFSSIKYDTGNEWETIIPIKQSGKLYYQFTKNGRYKFNFSIGNIL